jgi:oligogalacturonide lyase
MRTGISRQLTAGEAVAPGIAALARDERTFCWVEGDSARQSTVSGARDREICRLRADSQTLSLAVGNDARVAIVECGGGKWRLSTATPGGGRITIMEAEAAITDVAWAPTAGRALLYRTSGAMYVTDGAGGNHRRAPTPPGEVIAALWAPSGASLLYLHRGTGPAVRVELREHTLAGAKDEVVAPTSQFGSFAPNGDASVFIGSSDSKAQPHVLILVRKPKREFTLCEHRSSQPESVRPQFTPGSQRILFQSDRHGKPAIYTMAVERLVEETE